MKKKLLFALPMICLLIFIRFASVESIPYTISDSINDVRHYQQANLVSTGDFHDEIDIVGFEVDTN